MGQVLRRHDKSTRKGEFVIPAADRLFNPSRETARLFAQVAHGTEAAAPLTQSGPEIRALAEYQAFFEQHAHHDAPRTAEPCTAAVDRSTHLTGDNP